MLLNLARAYRSKTDRASDSATVPTRNNSYDKSVGLIDKMQKLTCT